MKACLIGCGRMGTTIDDEIRGHPHRTPTLPWAHAAGFVVSNRTELVAVSDVDAAKVEATKARYNVPRGYDDYRDMILTEKPDIIGIATRPAPHAEMTIFAAENGVKGVYCEKPLCCSMDEADAMVEAVERNGVKFNYGTNRRYSPIFRKMRQLIDDSELGDIQAVIGYCGVGSAQWWHTHAADVFLNMAQDAEVEYVHGAIRCKDEDWDGNTLRTDPCIEMGYVKFVNGVRAYWTAATGYEFEVSGSKGKLRTLNDYNVVEWRAYESEWNTLQPRDLPPIPPESATVNLIDELADAIENDGDTSGNIQIARRSQEIIFGVVESHRLNGARVPFPMQNRGLTITRDVW